MKKFELKKEHIKLLKEAWVRDSRVEFGAPEIDGKRPYGNSYVEGDVADILGWDYNEELSSEQEDEATRIHRETTTALQIILSTSSFDCGVYENYEEYDDTKWRKVCN